MNEPTSLLITDADNTLWDTDQVFSEAQLELLNSIESQAQKVAPTESKLQFVRYFDQTIAATHPQKLKYPVRLLIDALTAALGAGDTKSIEFQTLESRYYAQLSTPPALRDGVYKGLEKLRAMNIPVIVASEGNEASVRRNIKHHKLDKFVENAVFAPKSKELFSDIVGKHKAIETAICVGDQLDRDIIPAKEAGLKTLFFPGGFSPAWTQNLPQSSSDFVITSYDEVPDHFQENQRH